MHEIETENLNGSKEIYDFAACVGEKLNLEGREVVKNANEMLQKVQYLRSRSFVL